MRLETVPETVGAVPPKRLLPESNAGSQACAMDEWAESIPEWLAEMHTLLGGDKGPPPALAKVRAPRSGACVGVRCER